MQTDAVVAAVAALFLLYFPLPASGQCTGYKLQKLTASDGGAGDLFGYSVAASGNVVLVGAAWDDPGAGSVAGSAYAFRFDGTRWVEEQKLGASDAAAYDWFGSSVAMTGNVAIVGARWDDTGTRRDTGSAYVFAITSLALDASSTVVQPGDTLPSQSFGFYYSGKVGASNRRTVTFQ